MYKQNAHKIAHEAIDCLRASRFWQDEACRRYAEDCNNQYGIDDASSRADRFLNDAYELFILYKKFIKASKKSTKNKIMSNYYDIINNY